MVFLRHRDGAAVLNTPSLRAAFACLALLQASAEVHAQVYRCEQDGKLAFSDQPCKAGAKGSQKTYATPGVSGTLDFNVAVNHYPVQGSDYETLSQSLRANGPKGFHGLASWKIGYEYTYKKVKEGCRVNSVKVKVTGDILMPRWTNENAAPPELRQRWSTYYAALKTHEDGHLQHGREMAMLVKERLMGIGVVPCEQMQAATEGEFKRVSANLKARDQDYDKRTNHGETQGARF